MYIPSSLSLPIMRLTYILYLVMNTKKYKQMDVKTYFHHPPENSSSMYAKILTTGIRCCATDTYPFFSHRSG